MGEVPGDNKRGRWKVNPQRGCAGMCVQMHADVHWQETR